MKFVLDIMLKTMKKGDMVWYLIALAIFVYIYLNYFKYEKDRNETKQILNKVDEYIEAFLQDEMSVDEFRKKIYIAMRVNKIPNEKEKQIIDKILERIINKMTNDKFLSFDKINKLEKLLNAFNYKINNKLNKQIEMSKIINKLILTKELEEYNYNKAIPIILKESEKLINVLNNVSLIKIVKHTRYEGGGSGVGVRLAKGLYYRTGTIKGRKIVDEKNEKIDNGNLFLTSENLYFIGKKEKIKIPYRQIVTLEPYADAVTISKSGNAKPVTFATDDAWFIYALVTHILKYDI